MTTLKLVGRKVTDGIAINARAVVLKRRVGSADVLDGVVLDSIRTEVTPTVDTTCVANGKAILHSIDEHLGRLAAQAAESGAIRCCKHLAVLGLENRVVLVGLPPLPEN